MNVHLKRLRQEHDGMTQQALAAQIGVTRQTIIAIELGNYQPSVELALRLARELGTSVEAIFELAEESEPKS